MTPIKTLIQFLIYLFFNNSLYIQISNITTTKHLSIAFILIFNLLSISTQGLEVDNFSYRNRPLEDSTEVLNRWVHEDFKKVEVQLKGSKIPCSDDFAKKKELMDALKKYLVAEDKDVGIYEQRIKKELNEKQLRKIDFTESIYRDDNFLKNAVFSFAPFLDPVIKINGSQIGADKISHFFDQGFKYYKYSTNNKKSQKEILEYFGPQMEKTDYGCKSSGVYSHADLNANFEGFRFWNRIMSSPISQGTILDNFGKKSLDYQLSNSYFICSESSWQINPKVKFDFRDYVTDMMDESTNCNFYDLKKELIIAKNLKSKCPDLAAEQRQCKPLRCPTKSESCVSLSSYFQSRGISENLAAEMIHPECLKLDPQFLKKIKKWKTSPCQLDSEKSNSESQQKSGSSGDNKNGIRFDHQKETPGAQ